MKKLASLAALIPAPLLAQTTTTVNTDNWLSSPGIIGTFVLIALVLTIAVIILAARMSSYLNTYRETRLAKKTAELPGRTH